jgi:hypothetical protein
MPLQSKSASSQNEHYSKTSSDCLLFQVITSTQPEASLLRTSLFSDQLDCQKQIIIKTIFFCQSYLFSDPVVGTLNCQRQLIVITLSSESVYYQSQPVHLSKSALVRTIA